MTQTTTSATKPSIKVEIARLIGLRTQWEQAVTLTNRQLYDLLAEVAGLAKSYLRDELVTLATIAGFKPAKNTSDVLIAVKLVFGFDTDEKRKKASAYAKAIENGLAAKQTPVTLAAWFAGIGGLEAARKNAPAVTPLVTPPAGPTATPPPAQASSIPAQSVSSDVIAEAETKAVDRAREFLANAYSALTLDKAYFPDELPFVESGYCAVLMCPTKEGHYQQLFVSSKNEVVNALLKALGRALDREANPDEALTSHIIATAKDAPDESELDALYDQAAAA